MRKISYTIANLVYTFQVNFTDATEAFKRNPNSKNFRLLTEAAVTYQQIEWLRNTLSAPAADIDFALRKIVMELPNEQWGKAVVDYASQLA